MCTDVVPFGHRLHVTCMGIACLSLYQDALKESQRRRRELEDYRQSVENLQKWIEDTKNIQDRSSEIEDIDGVSEKHRSMQEQLENELVQHQELVQEVSYEVGRVVEGQSRNSSPDDSMNIESPSEDEVNAHLVQLSKMLAQRKKHLQETLAASHPETFEGESLNYYRFVHGLVSDADTVAKSATANRSIEELKACWERLNEQVDDKQTQLERNLQFQYLYQQAMQNISDWLDDVELRLFGSGFDKDTEQHLRENESLLNEIRSLQQEIGTMTKASQQVMSDVSAENKALMEQTFKV